MNIEQQILLDVPKTTAPLRLKVGKDIASYKRLEAGKPYKVHLRDARTGRCVATVFAGRKVAERIALCVNGDGVFQVNKENASEREEP